MNTDLSIFKSRHLVLALAIAAGLTACNKQDATPAAATPAPKADAGLTLDDSKLPPFNQFKIGDLDASKNACADFGGYVNGKWLASNPIPADRSGWGTFSIIVERSLAVQHQLAEQAGAKKDAQGIEKIVGDFWASGMDEAKINAQGIAPLKSRLDTIDGFADGNAVAEYLRTSAGKGENFLFSLSVDPDFKDSNTSIAYAFQGGLGLPDKAYYFDADKKAKLDAYEKHVAKVLELSGTAADAAAKQAKDIVAFETRLARVSRSSEELARDAALYYNPLSPADADKLAPNFPWTKFFESQGVQTPKMFSLAIPAFHAEVSKMLGDVPVDTWKAYLRFHTVDGAAPYLSEPFVQEDFEFHNRTMLGQKEMKPRWKRVLGSINETAGQTLGQLYVKAAFPAESKTRMQELVQNLRDALKARIEGLAWMSPETKQKALAKWAAFTPKIGYPDKWRDWSGLQTSRDSYIGNVLAANAFNYKWNLSKIGQPVDKTEWGMSPQTVNAYYNPQQNEIVFPAAILQPPFFDAKADDALNYGGIGAVIGHEMIHGYDDQGSRFGPTGNFENWWSPADAKGFAGLTGKLVAQFNGYEAMPGKHVNGNLTLGENIADLGGLNVAHAAFVKASEGKPDARIDGLPREQRFFLNFATIWRTNLKPELIEVGLTTDAHAPNEFRMIGVLSNMPEFAQAFSCKAGDTMVRDGDKQIVIW